MNYDQIFIDDVMFLFDEERQPVSQIAYIMNVPIDEIDMIICSQVANNVMEIVWEKVTLRFQNILLAFIIGEVSKDDLVECGVTFVES